MTDYYRRFGEGGFGGIVTEGVYTDAAFSQGYKNQPGIINDQQEDSWAALIQKVQATGTKVIMQLMHAGALSQFNRFSVSTGGPSAVRPKGKQMEIYHGSGDYPVPQEMNEADIETVIAGFVSSALRAVNAGADGIEIHGANGYLLDQFLTDYTNERTDSYGGSVDARVKLVCEIIARVRQALGSEATIGIRISQAKVNDYDHKWRGQVEDAKVIFSSLEKAGASYIHTTEHEADVAAFGEGVSLANLASKFTSLPIIANGSLSERSRAEAMVTTNQSQFVAIGKAALGVPDLPRRLLEGHLVQEFNPGLLLPYANLESAAAFQSR